MTAASVKIVVLPDLPPTGDIVNWVAVAGNDKERLLDLVSLTPDFNPDQPAGATAVPAIIEKTKRPRVSDVSLCLLSLAADLPLMRDDTETAWTYLQHETIPLRSRKFEAWLTLQHLNTFETIPSAEAINMAMRALEAKAIYEGEGVTLFNRVAWYEKGIIYDLGRGRAQKITTDGHETVLAPPLFRRWSHHQAHPDPLPSGDPFDFLKFCRVSDKDRHTVLIALITSFIPGIAQPLWDIHGSEGSGKSSFCRLVKRIVDPSIAELQIMQPEKETDFFLLLFQNYMVCLDNQSSLSARTSDLLCGAATGTAVSQRLFYSNIDTVLIRLKNIILMNGINPDLISRADLRDRAFRVPLDRIPKEERKEDRVIMEEFDAALPSILGGIFNTLSKALVIYPTVKLDELPRLADWYKYAYAVAEALGGYGSQFVTDYAESKSTQREDFLSLNSLATAVLKHMDDKTKWETTVGEAWNTLFELAYPEADNPGKSRDQRKPKTDSSFPGKPQDMRRFLERLKVTLADSGTSFNFGTRGREGVHLTFTREGTPAVRPVDVPGLFLDDSEV